MAIHNRGFGPSEQRRDIQFSNFADAITPGNTGVLCLVPFPCTLDAAQVAAFNVESSPFLMLTVSRFIPGTGFTSWNIGSTFAPRDFGTSGVLTGISLPASGSTLLLLMANDVIGYIAGGSGGTAGIVGGLAGCVVLKAIQDVKINLTA